MLLRRSVHREAVCFLVYTLTKREVEATRWGVLMKLHEIIAEATPAAGYEASQNVNMPLHGSPRNMILQDQTGRRS